MKHDFLKKDRIAVISYKILLIFLLLSLLLWKILNNSCTKNCEEINSVYLCEKCVKNTIPRVSRVLESVQYLLWTNKSLARFGDGEVSLILGRRQFFQRANSKLSAKLLKVLKSNSPKLLIGIPDIFTGKMPLNKDNYNFWQKNYNLVEWFINNTNKNKQYLAGHMSSPYVSTLTAHCELLDKVYETYRKIWDDKDIVFVRANHSQKYTYDIFDNARSVKTIYVPPRQTWYYYNDIKNEVFEEDKDKLYILSIGPVSDILAYDLVRDGRRALDLGHLPKDYDAYKKNIYDPRFYFD